MDQRDPRGLSGLESSHAHLGIPIFGPETQSEVPAINPMTNQNMLFQSAHLGTLSEVPAIHPLTNQNMSFQSPMSGSMGSKLAMKPSSHGVNIGAPSVVPPNEPVKRKRGRPFKYRLERTSTGMAAPAPKRNRGMSPGTDRKENLASMGVRLPPSVGMGFTPHVITIAVNEDIEEKIRSFAQQGPRVVSILSANGSVSSVTLRQAGESGDTIRYEGLHEIMSLSGLYLPNDGSGSQNQREGLTISLATADGHVVGGRVGEGLIAASPVQIIVGTFIWDDSKGKNKKRKTE